MKPLRVFYFPMVGMVVHCKLTPVLNLPVPIYAAGCREDTMRVKCLATNWEREEPINHDEKLLPGAPGTELIVDSCDDNNSSSSLCAVGRSYNEENKNNG